MFEGDLNNSFGQIVRKWINQFYDLRDVILKISIQTNKINDFYTVSLRI